MESRLFLDVIVREGSAIFQLLSSKDQTLLVWRNSLLVLDFGFDIFNGIRGFHFQSDSLASQSFDENLHSSTETEDKMESRLFLDVIVREGSAIFQLLSSKDQTLLVWRNSLLVLDFGLDIFNSVRGLYFQRDCFAGQGFHENLHSTSETQHQMQCTLLLDV